MQNGDKVKIDESIKVASWTANFVNQEEAAKAGFDQYGSQQIEGPNAELSADYSGFGDAEEVRVMESGFRKLKREQIDKLRDLKSEYENIRRIATDYVGGEAGSKTPSGRSSSSISQSRVGAAPVTPVSNYKQNVGGKQTQILELQKKQLQVMVQNSMKKIQQLLHNEMQYKKTIHELKLHPHHTKVTNDHDKDPQHHKLHLKREKELNQRILILESERESVLSSQQTLKEKLRTSELRLDEAEQHLKRVSAERKNLDDLMRTERDKYLNLEIQLRRQRKEHQIASKDSQSQIRELRRMMELKEGSLEKQLRVTIHDLQDELRIRQDRYSWLLHKLEVQQKSQDKVDQQTEIKMVNQILSQGKSDPSVFQDTMANLVQRLNQLQNRPARELKPTYTSDNEQESLLTMNRLKDRMRELERKIAQQSSEISTLSDENEEMRNQLQGWQERERLWESQEEDRQGELERLKKQVRHWKSEKKLENVVQVQSQLGTIVSQTRDLEEQIEALRQERYRLVEQRDETQRSTDQLREEVSRLRSEVEKARRQSELNCELLTKEHNVRLAEMGKNQRQLQEVIKQLTLEKKQLISKRENELRVKEIEISRLREYKEVNESRSRQAVVASGEGQGETYAFRRLKEEHTAKVNELMGLVQNLTIQNHQLQERSLVNKQLAEDNDRLKQYLRHMRAMDEECDRLWARKEGQYQRIEGVMRGMKL